MHLAELWPCRFICRRAVPPQRRVPPANLDVVVAAGTAEIEKQLSFLAVLFVVTGLATMAVSGAVAWLVVSRGLRPLDEVAETMAGLDETGLKQRVANDGVPREIEPVVRQLNGLLERLDEAFERERTLTADVAHELRTPVAEIRTIAEITLNRLRDPEEYRRAHAETLDAVRTLQGMIETLLVLARLEAGQLQPRFCAVPLQPLLAQHWAQVGSGAEARGVSFEHFCPSDVVLSADPSLLDVVLSNVLANAATYASDGGSISVEVRPSEAHCQVRISNTGSVVNRSEVARVFDRFWRADPSRGSAGRNCGLGLSLVRRAMEVMGGQAEAGIGQDDCFTLSLTFQTPAQPPAGPRPH